MSTNNMLRATLIAISLALVSSAINAQTKYLPTEIQNSILGRLEGPDMGLGAVEPAFVRYAANGAIEDFKCEPAAAFHFYAFHSDGGGGITVGECSKTPSLDANYADTQTKAFEIAAGASNLRIPAGQLPKPVVSKIRDATVIYLPQFLASGVGGMGGHGFAVMKSVLIVPAKGQKVVLAQGVAPGNCGNRKTPEACDNFPGLLQGIAELVAKMRGLTPGTS